MVAITGGQGFGVNLGLTGVLNDRGLAGQAQAGRNGQRVYVNGSTGNLVVQTQDEQLFDHGLDLGVSRTYNSQGQLEGGAGNPGTGLYARRAELVEGELGSYGSVVRRTERDGSQTLYRLAGESDRYFPETGTGAGSIGVVDGALVWRSADGALEDVYDAGSGRLQAAVDAAGYRVDYAYDDAGLLKSAVSDSGEAVYYDYTGTNLVDVRTHIQDADGRWRDQTRVRYEYDALNRLSGVVVDLSPEDNTVADGRVYRTDYRYDGDSGRLASISQSDGSSLVFSYVEQDGVFRVASVTEGGTSNPDGSYNTTTNGADGSRTVWHYDVEGRLLLQTWTAADGSRGSVRHDGAATTTVLTNADGSATTENDDGAGYVTRSATDAVGRLVNTSWSRADGSNGHATYRGPYATFENYDAQGRRVEDGDSMAFNYATRNTYAYDANGDLASTTSVSQRTGGAVSTRVTYADGRHESTERDGTGAVVSSESGTDDASTWQDADGSQGSFVTEADGSTTTRITYPDGSTSVELYHQDGTDRTTTYDANGRQVSDVTVQPDGTTVTTTFEADGSTRVRTGAPDGTSTTVDDDGHGNVVTTHYDAYGNRTAASWTHGDGSTGTDSFDLAGLPVLDQEQNQQPEPATAGSAFSWTVPAGLFVSPTGAAITYTVRGDGAGNLPAWLHFDAASHTLSGTPTNAEAGGYRVVVVAHSADGLVATSDLSVIVQAANAAPAATGTLPDRQAVQGMSFDYAIAADAFADPDLADTLGYTATLADGAPLPDWLVFDAATRRFSGVPLGVDVGTIEVRVTAIDGALASATATFRLTVGAAATGDAVRRGQTFEYDPGAGYTVYTDPLGRQTRLSYYGGSQIETISGPGGGDDVQIGYDGNGRMTSLRDRAGNTTNMYYDDAGRMTYRGSPYGPWTEWTYDERGELLSERASNGSGQSMTRYVYADAPSDPSMRGLLRFSVTAEGRVTEYRYDAHGQRIATLVYAGLELDASRVDSGTDVG